ncbi:NmrA family NAD(P)-binding protein [uncultured Maribacter sp.]|uniref:NmrA family NAD(P)-binding protein n=1 Tax=uncultured Maribacter sp. TaxID=431308 RepID=UPI00263539E5|nr:NmrA family NAD(P)-binding protein [uncultured Maribacter sp.]
MNNKKILVTAANGNTGFPASKELLKLGFEVRAFVRNPQTKKAKELKELGAEIFVGDIQDIRDVRKSLENIESAYFVPTYPNVLFQGSTFATAVEEMKTKNVVVLTQWLSSNSHPSVYTKEHWLVDQTFKRLQNTNITFVNPGLFAFVYFMMPEPMLQFGMMTDFGTNAPPSNEDIGLTVAHILKKPEPHIGKTYRITSRELLKPQEMADIVGKIVGRKIKADVLPESMLLKMLRSYGFPQRDASQVIHYVKDGHNGGFALNAPTTTVQDIVGKLADDFETITRRYLKNNPMVKQSLLNKLRTTGIMMKAITTTKWNMAKFEKEQGFPAFKNMMSSNESEEWKSEHLI